MNRVPLVSRETKKNKESNKSVSNLAICLSFDLLVNLSIIKESEMFHVKQQE